MKDLLGELDAVVPLPALLGYLTFSTGKPDARFQRQLCEAYSFLKDRQIGQPWQVLAELLRRKLDLLHASDSPAFRDTKQAKSVLELSFEGVIPAYRHHHADLLGHLSDDDLFQPFFLVRVIEAALIQGAPWEDDERIVENALKHLNDFVGHRPLAILETRPRGEPYDHERVRPIPLYLRGAGLAPGQYRTLLEAALDVLRTTDSGLLTDAGFNLDLLDELALDPRAYDHGHPANKRPNYVYGEWDPHHLDHQGRYRRFVLRQITLDGLQDRVANPGSLPPEETLFEAAAVLAGVMLMASGNSGGEPATHDSSTTLSNLVPRIARNRDAFYSGLLNRMAGAHAVRLQQEATRTRQPFGAARQHLNQYLARHRAAQMQERHLALLFAEMGQPVASRARAQLIPTASLRFQSEIAGRLTTGDLLLDRGELDRTTQLLAEAEDLIRRGIDCGALADPWNALGFQCLFPLSPAREDSVRDHRVDELVHLIEQLFKLHARLLSEAAAQGARTLVEKQLPAMGHLAAWWDRFATTEVQDVRHVRGAEATTSAEHVATALTRWHLQGEAPADLAFWRQHLDGFRTPKAFALVVETLLRKKDYRAAMALLMTWLSQAEQVPLEDGDYSFHGLALRWLLALTSEAAPDLALGTKFFDYLEANADEYWHVPVLEPTRSPVPAEKDDVYGAAYEDMTFRDSGDDDQDGNVMDGTPLEADFDLDAEGEHLGQRLRFLSTVARLWAVASRQSSPRFPTEVVATWHATAREHHARLLALLDALHAVPVTDPLGSYESIVEYERRRNVKEQLTYAVIGTCLEFALAVGSLGGCLAGLSDSSRPLAPSGQDQPAWEPLLLALEQAFLAGDVEGVRTQIVPFLEKFQEEPLLFIALADGGEPRQILRARLTQSITQTLAAQLPRLGLLRESYIVLRAARDMEQRRQPPGRSVTEFNQLFEVCYIAVLHAVLDSIKTWEYQPKPEDCVHLLEQLTEPFLELWIDHSESLRLAALESSQSEGNWQILVQFVQSYGSDLFHARFMTLANLRGILHRGMGPFLDFLRENPDPMRPVRLIDDLEEGVIARPAAEANLRVVLQAVAENYEEYKDYNTTTTLSDYGENLCVLLNFLRLKASYERHSWQFRPLVQAHDTLARCDAQAVAVLWQDAFAELTAELAKEHLDALEQLEQEHGIRLRTVTDRLEERFVRPLAVDRLCASIEAAMNEALEKEQGPAFAHVLQQLETMASLPTGVGLDVPPWLKRLSAEVHRVKHSRSGLVVLAQRQLGVPRITLTPHELDANLHALRDEAGSRTEEPG